MMVAGEGLSSDLDHDLDMRNLGLSHVECRDMDIQGENRVPFHEHDPDPDRRVSIPVLACLHDTYRPDHQEMKAYRTDLFHKGQNGYKGPSRRRRWWWWREMKSCEAYDSLVVMMMMKEEEAVLWT